MKTIPTNINDNPWGYVLKNNILAFYTGPFSQWFGSFKNQSAPFTINLDQCVAVYPFETDYYFIDTQRFFDYYDTPDKPYELKFNTAEQAMMFGKAILFHDYETADQILLTSDAKTQKELGRQVKNYNDELWPKRRLKWVTKVNYQKFKQNPELKDFLVNTCKNYILVEASPYDRIWGIGTSTKDEDTFNVDAWNGQNLLGKALMRVRDMLENE
jgi:ribA/ribD-fused uncharacterized protein